MWRRTSVRATIWICLICWFLCDCYPVQPSPQLLSAMRQDMTRHSLQKTTAKLPQNHTPTPKKEERRREKIKAQNLARTTYLPNLLLHFKNYNFYIWIQGRNQASPGEPPGLSSPPVQIVVGHIISCQLKQCFS